jgi:hypothetical protein
MTIYKGKFEQNLTVLLSRLISDMDKETTLKLTMIKDEMIGRQKGQVVKINHSYANGTIVQKMDLKAYMKRAVYKVVIFTLKKEPQKENSKQFSTLRLSEALDKYFK